jgi:hypothetical protein
MAKPWRMLLAAIAILASGAASAATPRPLFAGHEVIHIVIKAPFWRLKANRAADAPPVDGVLITPGDAPETLPIKLSLRGVTRRRADICAFPPLRVEFPDKPPHGSLFEGQKKLKLITHCLAPESARKYVLLEYAAYRMANVLTPLSFNVRLVSVDYQEADGRPVVSRYGVFIESEKDVAKRNGLTEAKPPHRIAVSALNAAAAARYAVFEYMIGNVDWSMTLGAAGEDCCHNTKLLGEEGAAGDLIPIAHDFDSAGLVDPPYALPPQGSGIDDIRDRRYRGYCRHRTEAEAAAARILAERTKMFAVLDETPGLDPSARRVADSYLGRFFDQAAADPTLAGWFRTCLS